MYASLKGRYREHIINHNLPENLLVRPLRPKKSVVFAEESWAKREEPAPKQEGKSKYYSIPKKEPKPKTKVKSPKKVDKTDSSLPKDRKLCDMSISEQVKFLWTCPDTEMVVSKFQSTYTLRHAEFNTLRPHELVNGEAMECYMYVVLHNQNKAGCLYLLNHFLTNVILHGTQQQMVRQGLSTVNFESYEGAISFVNINRNHWKFVYLHALSEQIFVVDPLTEDLEDSKQAAKKFQ
ncbi:uncharacterized protein [Chanodichthys erythropterus]|uniref:uncharacterized protein n=1 Tax=Chanodichthys erythropterus TaxID=933992 RepID=UPI00351EB888